MCEQDMVKAMASNAGWRERKLSRRDFGRFGAATGAGLLVAGGAAPAFAQSALSVSDVKFNAPGGQVDGQFIYPREGRHPAVIIWPDIAGIRDAARSMANQLASSGYAVLIANPYYRSVEGEQFEDFDAWRNGGGFDRVRPWMAANTPAAIAETHVAVVEWLDRQRAVDTARGIGVQGYCMTGGWTIRAAAAVPGRIKAAASFHGGGLVGAEADSPVNLLASMADDAKLLVAIARNDDAQAPGDKDALRAAADAAGLAAEIEVYNADHGWTVPDSPSFDVDEADRAWERLLAMYAQL